MGVVDELVQDLDERLAQIIEQRRELREQVEAEHDRANQAARQWEDRVAAAVQDAKKLPTPPPEADVRTLAAAVAALDHEEVALKAEREQRIRASAAELEDAIAQRWQAIAAEMRPHVDALKGAADEVKGLLSDDWHVRVAAERGVSGIPNGHRRADRSTPASAATASALVEWITVGIDPTAPAPVPRPPWAAQDDEDEEPVPVEEEVEPARHVVAGARL